MADDTIIVFTSDHGDSLGERGLLSRCPSSNGRSGFPSSCTHRLPSPRAGWGRTSPTHIDLLPTLLDIACDGAATELAAPIDGLSLASLASGSGDDWPDLVCTEYTAEDKRAPLVMVRKGPCKLITCPTDPPLLFDLEAAPDERENLAEHPGHVDVRAELEAAVNRTWDIQALDTAVRQSQSARRLVGAALDTGSRTPWDFQLLRDAPQLYFREGGDIQASYSGTVR